jgi:hypothetical protein
VVLAVALGAAAPGAACEKAGELQFNFSNLKVREAYAIFADFAGLKPDVDPSIQDSGPMRFGCTHWRVAAQNLAREYGLRMKVEGGFIRVSR